MSGYVLPDLPVIHHTLILLHASDNVPAGIGGTVSSTPDLPEGKACGQTYLTIIKLPDRNFMCHKQKPKPHVYG